MRFLLIFLLSLPAWASVQWIPGSANSAVSNSATRFLALNGTFAPGSTRLALQQTVSTPGTFSRLCVVIADPTAGGSKYTFLVEKNAGATAITFDINAGSTTGCDSTHSFSVVANDLVNLSVTPSGTPSAVTPQFSILFTGTTTNESLIMGGGASTSAMGTSSATPTYNRLSGEATWDTTAAGANRLQIAAAAGTIKNLYVTLDGAPGAAASGKSYTFTVYQNSNPTSLSCVVLETATTCNDTNAAHNITVAAGDTFSIESLASATAPTARGAGYGTAFVSTTDGESLLMAQTTTNWNAGSANYGIVTSGAAPSATEATFQVVGQTGVSLKKLYFQVTNIPNGATKSWTVITRKNSTTNGNLTCAIVDTATACNNTNTDTMADFDLWNIRNTPANTPAASGTSAWGLVGYIAPTATQRRVSVVNQ